MIDIQVHKFYLINILKDIYTNASIRSLLGFKGGTAAHLFYGLPRFSVDLDFDLLEIKESDKIFAVIDSVIKSYGEIKDEYNTKFTLFFLLSYSKGSQNIKIEISKRIFNSHYEVRNYLGISMLTMVKEDIFAYKLVSLLERKIIASRDLFDLWFFMKNHTEINKSIVESRSGLPYKEYLSNCIKAVENYDERYILQGIGELLDIKLKNWVKENLKKELLFQLKLYLELSN